MNRNYPLLVLLYLCSANSPAPFTAPQKMRLNSDVHAPALTLCDEHNTTHTKYLLIGFTYTTTRAATSLKVRRRGELVFAEVIM